jgi:GNAT superfamily N-acetyltransferase
MYLTKRGKTVYVESGDDSIPLRELPLAAARKNLIVGVGPFGPVGEVYGYHRNTHVLYFLQDGADRPALRKMVQLSDIIAMFPRRRRAMFGPGTLDMFWQNPKTKALTKLLAGAVQYVVLGKEVMITHMSVRPKWRRNGINTLMIEAIEATNPGKPLVYEDPTDMGKKFMASRGLGDAVLEMMEAGFDGNEVCQHLRNAGLSAAEARTAHAFGELIYLNGG